LYFSIGLVVIFFGAVFTAAVSGGITLPSPQGQVNPADLANTDFATPGVRELAPGEYEAYLVGQVWFWQPNEIRIPAGSKLTLYLTSRDVQHGFKVVDTDINVMVIPGQVSRVQHVFDKPGEYLIVCHEYCGIQHQTMAGKIIVEAPADVPAS
jgi:cytochrome c oxidase subunit 2